MREGDRDRKIRKKIEIKLVKQKGNVRNRRRREGDMTKITENSKVNLERDTSQTQLAHHSTKAFSNPFHHSVS